MFANRLPSPTDFSPEKNTEEFLLPRKRKRRSALERLQLEASVFISEDDLCEYDKENIDSAPKVTRAQRRRSAVGRNARLSEPFSGTAVAQTLSRLSLESPVEYEGSPSEHPHDSLTCDFSSTLEPSDLLTPDLSSLSLDTSVDALPDVSNELLALYTNSNYAPTPGRPLETLAENSTLISGEAVERRFAELAAEYYFTARPASRLSVRRTRAKSSLRLSAAGSAAHRRSLARLRRKLRVLD